MAGACRREGTTASPQRRLEHKVPFAPAEPQKEDCKEHCGASGVHAPGVEENVTAAEIHKLEAASRMAMGHFEGQATAMAAKSRNRFLHPASALLALAAFALVLAVL